MIIESFTYFTDSSFDDFVTNLMHKRVGQGYPDASTVIVGEKVCPSYGWTDGINHILSIFWTEGQAIKELCLVNRPA